MKVTLSTEHLRTVFAQEDKYENFQKLCLDMIQDNTLTNTDENGNQVAMSRRDGNNAIRKVLMDVCGLTQDDLPSKKRRHRALEEHRKEICEIFENPIDFKINAGFRESEWFNQFVETHNLNDGDAAEFTTETDTLFIVSDYSGDNHDLTMQQYPTGKAITITPTPKYIKTGKDIDLILLGRIDFAKWVSKIAESYVQYVQKLAYDAVVSVKDELPSEYKGQGALSATTKDDFDEWLEQVSTANGSNVVIMGTKVALKKITKLADVDWASDDQKKSIADLGRLGSYEGTALVEIEQRLSLTDKVTRLIDNNLLFAVPVSEDKFVKMVDGGETELTYSGKGQHQDDFETTEISRDIGIGLALGQYIGIWDMNP